ncbi:MAG: hypothetical protein HQK54_14990, partial [Oligoflexales bacterium]|nr:hypothetical protein [Oligoflexales bacterium]
VNKVLEPVAHLIYRHKSELFGSVCKNNFKKQDHISSSAFHYCIANTADEVMNYKTLCDWALHMRNLGVNVHLETFQNLGHLKAHKEADRYSKIWKDIFDDNLEFPETQCFA